MHPADRASRVRYYKFGGSKNSEKGREKIWDAGDAKTGTGPMFSLVYAQSEKTHEAMHAAAAGAAKANT